MKSILVLSFSLGFIQAFSQIPEKEWDRRYGGGKYETLHSIERVSNGYVLGGNSNSLPGGDVTGEKDGQLDYWIVMINDAGFKLWDDLLGSDKEEYFQGSAPGDDGGVLHGGLSTSNAGGDKSEDNYSQAVLGKDMWVIYTDAAGNKLWDKTIGGSSRDLVADIINVPGDGFLIGGFSSSSDHDKSEPCLGTLDYWIVRISNEGEILWDETLGGPGPDQMTAVINTADGGYLLGGTSASHIGGDKTEDKYGTSKDFWAVKVDATGNKEWDHRFGSIDLDRLEDMIATSDGNYLLCGFSNSPAGGDKTQNSQGSFDMWLVKVNQSGEKIWDRRFGGSGDDRGMQIVEVNDGYIVGGSSSSGISGDKTQESKGLNDMWLVKTDFSGNKIWDASFGTDASEGIASMVLTPDGSLLLGGSTSGGVSGDKSQPGLGANDYWILKTTPVTLRESGSMRNKGRIMIYPNPFSESIGIVVEEFPPSEIFQMELLDAAGRIFLQRDIRNQEKISFENTFPPGIYFVRLRKDDVLIGIEKIISQ